MKIQQIRNATLIVTYAGKRFLVDPMLANKGAYPGFPGSRNDHLRNPLVALPVGLERILDVDAVIVTHLHPDHWDEAAKSVLPRSLPIFTQNATDRDQIAESGFDNVCVLEDGTSFDGIALTRTSGQHGTDAAYEIMGDRLGSVCGVVFTHPEERTLYIAGDTIWNDHVARALSLHEPDVIVLNAGDAQFPALGSIIMKEEDVAEVARAAPAAQLIASHMEAVNHCMLSRETLKAFAASNGFGPRFKAPEDGETLAF